MTPSYLQGVAGTGDSMEYVLIRGSACGARDAGVVTGHESASRAAESQVALDARRQSTPRSSPRPRSHYWGHSVTQPGHDLPFTLHQPHLLLVAFVYQVHWTPPPRCPRPGTRGGLSLCCPPQTGTPSVRPLKLLRTSQYRSRDRETLGTGMSASSGRGRGIVG